MDIAAEGGDHILHVGQPEAEAFHIVTVARVDAIEFLENLFQVLFFDADAVVGHSDNVAAVGALGGDAELEGSVGVLVFYGVVHEVEHHVGEMHLVHKHHVLRGFHVCVDGAAGGFHFEAEGRDDVLNDAVGVELFALEGVGLFLKHRHLQHFLHLETQPFRFVDDNSREVLEHRFAFRHGAVAEHLRRQGDGGNGRFELVRHIVDKVVLNLREPLLAEYRVDGEDEGDEQHEGEDDGGDDEAHA